MTRSRAPIVSAALWVGLGQVAGQGLSLLIFLVLARFVSKESFGTVAVSLAAIEFLRRLVLDPIATSVLAKPDVTQKDYDEAFTLILIAAGASGLFVLLGADLIAMLIGSPHIEAPLRALVVMLLSLSMAAIPAASLARRGLFRVFALRTTISVLTGGAVGIGLALSGWGLWSLVGQQVVGNLVAVAMLWRAADWRPRLTLSRRAAQAIIARARHLSMTALWNTLAQESDLVLVSATFGPAVAGIYNAAKRIMLSINLLLVHAVSGLMLPTFANIREDARGASFLASLRFTSLASAPAFVGLAVLSPNLVNLILGESWSETAPILAALAASGYFLSLAQIGSSLLIVCDRQRLDARCAGASAVLGITAVAIALPAGPIAVATAVSLAALAALPLRLHFAAREVGVSLASAAEAILPTLMPALAMGMLVMIARSIALAGGASNWVVVLAGIPLGVLLYTVSLRVLSPTLYALVVDALGHFLLKRRQSRVGV